MNINQYIRANTLKAESRSYLIRERDGMPLAKGYCRLSLEKMGEVFRSLGVPCYVRAGHKHALYQKETESRPDFLRRTREMYASMRSRESNTLPSGIPDAADNQ